jgi:hypothetical protein
MFFDLSPFQSIMFRRRLQLFILAQINSDT